MQRVAHDRSFLTPRTFFRVVRAVHRVRNAPSRIHAPARLGMWLAIAHTGRNQTHRGHRMHEGELPKGWRIYAEPPTADGRCRLRLIAPNGISSTWWLRSNMIAGQVVCALATDQDRSGVRHKTQGVIDRRSHGGDTPVRSRR